MTFNSIRTWLLASHLFIIAFCLAVIAVTLVIFLARANPLENALVFERLSLELQVSTRLVQLLPERKPEEIIRDIQDQLDNPATRVLLLDPQNRIVADSAQSLVGRPLSSVGRPLARPALDGPLLRGSLPNLDGETWLYVMRPPRADQREFTLLLAAPQASNPLRTSVMQGFVRIMIGAGLAGLLLSMLLAWIIARSIAQPIQCVAQAAGQIADGDYSAQVPVAGPVEVRELASNFNDMAEHVKLVQTAQRDFVANVSHDLKTPLTSIQGFAQAISEGAASAPDEVRRSAGIIHQEASRLARMVAELLDIARIESGQIVMRRDPVRVGDILKSCVEQLEPRIQAAGVSLDMQVGEDLPVIPADGDRLMQVFTNLLDNALHHSPPGSTLSLLARNVSGSSIVRRGKTWPAGIELSVVDHGPGIPPEDLPRIFERFYQVDKSRQREKDSLGLGLFIVKQIVEAHGGTVKAESVLGLGTRIVVTLPAASHASISEHGKRAA